MNGLSAGEVGHDTYNVVDSYGTVRSFVVDIYGANDKPITAGPIAASAQEDGGLKAIFALNNASDPDHNAVLSVVDVPSELPAGVSYDAESKYFTIDPTNAAYQSLSQGEVQTVTVSYAVSDGIAAPIAQTAAFILTGVNDAPVVTAPIIGRATEDGPRVTLDARANTTDVDHNANLSVVSIPGNMPAGVVYDADSQSFILDPTDTAYQSLGQGEMRTVAITYAVSDGIAVPVAQTASYEIMGINDAPAAIPDMNALLQRASVVGNVLTNDYDIDSGDTFRVDQIVHGAVSTAVTSSGVQLAGVYGTLTIMSDGSYSYAANQEGKLAVGQTGTDTFLYSVTDDHGGMSTAALSVIVTGSVQGDASNNIIIAAAGNNVLTGGAGDDTVVLNFNLIDASIGYDATGHTFLAGPNGALNTLSGFEHFQFTDGNVSINSGSALIDDLFYYIGNKDVWTAGVDAGIHYNQAGWHEGRNPNAEFSTTGYLAANSDVAKAGINPLAHYDANGWKEGRDPSANFDNEQYLLHNPDVKAAGIDPLAHYFQAGQTEGRQTYAAIGKASDFTHGLFDAEYYLLANADVAKAALTSGGDTFAFAFQHYQANGWKEGRAADAYFDSAYYLVHNPDVAAAGVNPLIHYDQVGWKEGRDPSAAFHTNAYLAANPDIAAAHIDPLTHYLQYGADEGRHLA